MLFLLSTCRRKGVLHLLHLDHMETYNDRIDFELTGLPKTCTLQPPVNDLHLFPVHEFPTHPKLCSMTALEAYLQKTEHIRSSRDLFVTTTRPHAKVSPMTTRQWIVDVLIWAGINTAQFGTKWLPIPRDILLFQLSGMLMLPLIRS